MAHRRSPRARSQAGLTLLEIMAASALLAVFFISVFGLVLGMIEVRDRAERAALPYAVGPAVIQRVAEDLKHCVTEPYRGASFEGKSESVSGEDVAMVNFVTAVTSRVPVEIDDEMIRSHLTECGYRLRRSEIHDDYMALYRREDFGVDDEPLKGGKFYKLADRVVLFTIDYFEEDPGVTDGEEAEGEEEWNSEDKNGRLPWGCRITLVLAGTRIALDAVDNRPPEYTFVTYVAFPGRHDDVGE